MRLTPDPLMPRGAERAGPSPAVSVIVPVHDVAAHIGPCLQSLREQTFTDFEVVVVDDGSTDGSDGAARAAAGDEVADTELVHALAPRQGRAITTSLHILDVDDPPPGARAFSHARRSSAEEGRSTHGERSAILRGGGGGLTRHGSRGMDGDPAIFRPCRASFRDRRGDVVR